MKHFVLIGVASGAMAFGALGASAQDVAAPAVMDANGDGYVTESEFVRIKMSEDGIYETEARKAFAVLDVDGSGALSAEELEAEAKVDPEPGEPMVDDDTM